MGRVGDRKKKRKKYQKDLTYVATFCNFTLYKKPKKRTTMKTYFKTPTRSTAMAFQGASPRARFYESDHFVFIFEPGSPDKPEYHAEPNLSVYGVEDDFMANPPLYPHAHWYGDAAINALANFEEVVERLEAIFVKPSVDILHEAAAAMGAEPEMPY